MSVEAYVALCAIAVFAIGFVAGHVLQAHLSERYERVREDIEGAGRQAQSDVRDIAREAFIAMAEDAFRRQYGHERA